MGVMVGVRHEGPFSGLRGRAAAHDGRAVGDGEEGDLLIEEPLHALGLVLQVEGGRRLVHDDKARLRVEDARKGEALLLAEREDVLPHLQMRGDQGGEVRCE